MRTELIRYSTPADRRGTCASCKCVLPIYKSVTDYNNIWEEVITGNHQYEDPAQLHLRALEVMKPYFDKRFRDAIKDYYNKTSTGLSSSFAKQIVPATLTAKVSRLFVQHDAQLWGLFNEQTGEFVPTAKEQAGAENLIEKQWYKLSEPVVRYSLPKDRTCQTTHLLQRYSDINKGTGARGLRCNL